jgi:23S rRNA (guanosine2251-2'-O)-methyltransferase
MDFKTQRDNLQQNQLDQRNVREDLKSLDTEQIQQIAKTAAFDYAVCTINVLGELNIGTMARTAHLLGAKDFYVCGRKRFDRRSLVGANNYINISCIGDYNQETNQIDYQELFELIEKENYTPVILDTHCELTLGKFSWKDILPNKPIFIFGSESDGIDKDLEIQLRNKNAIGVNIPQWGVMRSHNVSIASGIVLWDFVNEIYS